MNLNFNLFCNNKLKAAQKSNICVIINLERTIKKVELILKGGNKNGSK